jgi:hypothetical protein
MTTAAELRIGQELPPLRKTALVKGDYRWGSPHHAGYATKVLGFRGALVPGVTTLAYVAEMLRSFFGPVWLERGTIEVNFIGGGAVDGDTVLARGVITGLKEEDGKTRVELEVWLEDEAVGNQKVLAGMASCLLG